MNSLYIFFLVNIKKPCPLTKSSQVYVKVYQQCLNSGVFSSSEKNMNAMQEVPLSKRNSVLLLSTIGLYLNVGTALPDVNKSRGLFISEMPFWRTAFGSWDSRTVHIPVIQPFTESKSSYDHVKKYFIECKHQNPRTSAEKQTILKMAWKQDLNNSNTNGHARWKGGNIMDYYPYKKNCRELMTSGRIISFPQAWIPF